MKRYWDEQELAEHWSLTAEEWELLARRTDRSRLGLAILLKFFQVEGRFPRDRKEVPAAVRDHLADQLGVEPDAFAEYDLAGRSSKRDRDQIRSALGFRRVTVADAEELVERLRRDVLPSDHKPDHLRQAAMDWCRRNRIEPPTPPRMERIIRSALKAYEEDFFAASHAKLPKKCRSAMDRLLQVSADQDTDRKPDTSPFAELRADPGRTGLKSLLEVITRLRHIDGLGLPEDLFAAVPPKVLQEYRIRAAGERPSELRRHPEPIRYTLVAAFCWQRRKEIIDGLVDLLIQMVHRIGARAERKVVRALLEDLRKVHGKTTLLYRIAEAAVETPDGIVREVLYPIAGEQTLRDLVREFKATGPAYQREVHTTLRSSYGNHYRRMLSPLLEALAFRSNNAAHRPVIDAIAFLKARRGSKQRYFAPEEGMPIDGVIRSGWKEIIIEKDKDGVERINRINYEIAVLQALRDRLRCKEIWVVGADRYRDPDEDLPADFEAKREPYYEALGQPRDADAFVAGLQQSLREALDLLEWGLPRNRKVKVIERGKGRFSVSPLEPQPEPTNLATLKAEIVRRWPMTHLLDVLKETNFRVGFTEEFRGASPREVLARDELQKRLLLCLYGLGTNTGLKRVSASTPDIGPNDLVYVRRRFVRKDSLRGAIARVVNAIFAARLPEIWGEGTTACASDSKKFGAWDQNLMTEWHVRYGGRGVMIYWHVERKSACIYSQLKRCSSSEVAAMIEGVLRHCTEMAVEKSYVDSHGQSEVAFAFCHLLGFELLPRLKGLSRQKLYRPRAEDPGDYPGLRPVLTRPINWDLIRRQHDEMVKYATALRLGTADAEAILRRFTRGNLKHPTYQALAELGKAVKTGFLCRYLHSEALRREVHEALNVVEQWNGTNGFIFYGKGGEVATNRLEDQEISMLCLHLLQIALVYVNTLMIQRVLSEGTWIQRLTEEDFRALTPLIYAHVNPYGRFELDMAMRLPLDDPAGLVA
ncbi:MAG: Tn3 family transposase [Singulisphaera sp.]|nr:Tn3 family transposase [Singulisphaera sp.]